MIASPADAREIGSRRHGGCRHDVGEMIRCAVADPHTDTHFRPERH